jgi:DNA helicase-2/ATP-dependent DNA helicase PcrA
VITPSAEQIAVITAPLTPLRVAAGAGTGKTTTIALRVVHLVSDLGLEPERILGITFTNKAAAELADRIRSALAPHVEPGREVEVHTYHGFAAQLLREFGALVGVERKAQVITPTFSRQILIQVLSNTSLPAVSIASLGAVEDLRRLASSLGDHLLQPSDIEIPPFGADDPWALRADLLKGLTVYQSEKTRLGVTDYGDLVLFAHRLVTRFPQVGLEIRDRYQAVMLDEYQDTNPAQREFLRALFPAGFPVTAVGDVDQTIYEWRGASAHNFEHFPEQFPLADGTPAPTLPLTENRRSQATVIAVCNVVREQTESAQSALVPLPDRSGGEVVVSWHADAVAEADWMARRLESLHGVHDWKDMAILFRKNKDMILVHDALRAAGIPVEVANLGGLLSVPEVTDLRAWLRILQQPEDVAALYRILTGSRCRLGMGDLAHLANWVRISEANNRASEDPDLFEHEDVPNRTLIEAIDHIDELKTLRPEANTALRRFHREYRELLIAAQGVSLVELCRRVLDRTGAWNDLAALPDAEQLTARLNIYRFLDLTEDWSPLEGRPSLPAFLSYLSLMEQDQTEELDTARLSGEDAVTLLTVHRAKGLEWEVVFVPACYLSNFPTQSRGFDNPYHSGRYLPYEFRLDRQWLPPLHEGIAKEEADVLLRDGHLRQEWRIAYVALTRAKQRLFISGAYWYGHPEPRVKPVKPSALWDVVRNHDLTTVESESGDPPPAPTLLRYEPETAAPDPLFIDGWDSALRNELSSPGWAAEQAAFKGIDEAFSRQASAIQQMLFDLPVPAAIPPQPTIQTSVTGLVTYATCPKRFFWSEVDRLPRQPNPAARRGTELHRRIELHNRGQMPLDDIALAVYDVPEDLPGADSPSDHPRPGQRSDLMNSYAQSRFGIQRPAMIEAPFEMTIAGLAVRGRVDAIYEPDPLDWEIVDFKSGRMRKTERSADAARVQLQAYAVAADAGAIRPVRPKTMKVTFAYLGDGLEELSEDVDHAWLLGAQERLDRIAGGIADHLWDPTPSEACLNCDFLPFCGPGRAFSGGTLGQAR